MLTQAPEPMVSLSRRAIHLWSIPLASPTPTSSLQILSCPERARAARLTGSSRETFVASHAAARQIIAGYVGLPPGDVALIADYGQRPRLADHTMAISLAHTEGLALLALSHEEVGVDVERSSAIPADEVEDLAAFILSPPERDQMNALTPASKPRALVEAWSRKEACLKLMGLGVSQVLMAEITVSGGKGSTRHRASICTRPEHYRIEDLELHEGFVGAVATETASLPVTSFTFEVEGR